MPLSKDKLAADASDLDIIGHANLIYLMYMSKMALPPLLANELK